MRTRHSEFLQKFALLSISLVLTSNTAISAALPLMLGFYKNQSQPNVELLMTVPQLSVVVFIMLSTVLARRIGQKRTVISGLIIALIAGIIPLLVTNFAIVMMSRVLLGAGFGLINALAVSMIRDFYSGDEAATLVGFQSAFQGLGSAVMTFTAGQLLKIGWQWAFLVYVVIIPIIWLFIRFVPEPPRPETTARAATATTAFTARTLSYGLLALVACIVYMTVSVKLSLYVTARHLGSASDAGTLTAIMQLANMAAGFGFGFVYRKLKRLTLPLAFLLTAVGFGLILTASNLILVGIGAALNGVAFSLYIPYIFNDATAMAAPGTTAGTTSIILVMANIGNFASPYGHAFLSRFGVGGSALTNVFLNGAIIMLALAVLFTVIGRRRDTSR